MNKFEKALLEQMDGQKNTQYCPVCEKETSYIYHKTGKANCPECNTEIVIDLTETIKQLKAMGVIVN